MFLNTSELLFGTEGLVCLCVHQVVEFCFVAHLHLDNPVPDGILVDKLRRFLQRPVHFDHGTAHGRVQVAGGLHALHCAKFLTGCHLVIHIGHVHIHHASQCVLCIIGDTNIAEVAFHLHKLV